MSSHEGDDDFVTKTHAELTRLSAEAKAERRYVAHRPCSDLGACIHCAKIRDIHRQISDHLLQLQGRDPEPWTDPQILAVYFHTPGDTGHPDADTCGICTRHRFTNQAGVRLCPDCDMVGTTEQLEQPTVE